LLTLDPVLTAKVLKAVNSCLYGLKRPVSSLNRAVAVLGLNQLRSLAISLSLPAMTGRATDSITRDYWVSSVSGAILARELATRLRHPAPDDDMVAALLRDLGEMVFHRAFPDTWKQLAERRANCLPDQVCELERAAFGIDHAEVAAELLARWQFPEDLVGPIRHHHEPHRLQNAPDSLVQRTELLNFVEYLTQLDKIVQNPVGLATVLTRARERYQLPQPALISFLQDIAPKIAELAKPVNLDLSQSPEFARALAMGSEALARLAVEGSRTSSGDSRLAVTGLSSTEPSHAREKSAALTSAASREVPLSKLMEMMTGALLPSGYRLGNYELREVIGRGTMGVVFKAYEHSLDRFVAIKILNPELASNSTARQRFAREAKIAAAIRHENVVAIYAVHEATGYTYLAMELVEGLSLEESIETIGPPPVAEILRLAGQIAAGLAAAHARGIIHRDIKPGNILVEWETGRVKITDFGLARGSVDAGLSREGSLLGTPLYMSPEQASGKPVDARSDLFSYGSVLYTMCTGRSPFQAQSIVTTLMNVCEQEAPSPRLIRPDIPEWLDAVILRLLRKKPEERYQSAAEVARLFDQHR
jgi:hypothetical protein